VGFIAIYVIAKLYERDSHWWPLIPGVILILIGVPKTAKIFRFLFDNWPLILVAIGLLVLIGAFRRTADAAPEEPPVDYPGPGEPAVSPASPEPEEPVEPKIE
jgi:hypothetical protein